MRKLQDHNQYDHHVGTCLVVLVIQVTFMPAPEGSAKPFACWCYYKDGHLVPEEAISVKFTVPDKVILVTN